MALIKAKQNNDDTISNVLDTMTQNKAVDIELLSINLLVPYHNHPFSLYSGERLEDMVDSIKENGVLTPIIVQPISDGKYEILAGHNRWNASKIAGKQTIPAIIKEGLSEEDAFMYVVETNIVQRGFDNLKLSEQATVITERADAFREEKRQAIQKEIDELNGNKIGRTDEAVGKEYELNPKRIQRLIRIHKYLIPELKILLDEGKIPFIPAVNLSHIDGAGQKIISELISEECEMTLKKSEKLKDYAKEGRISEEIIHMIMEGNKPEQVENAPEKTKTVRINKTVFSRYFPKNANSEQIKAVTEKALEEYFSNHPELTETEE